MLQLSVDPFDILRAPFGHLPEIEHTDFVEEFAQHGTNAVDALKVIGVTESGLNEQVGLVIFTARLVDRVEFAWRRGRGRDGRGGNGR